MGFEFKFGDKGIECEQVEICPECNTKTHKVVIGSGEILWCCKEHGYFDSELKSLNSH